MDDELILPGRPFNYRARDADALLTAMLQRIPTTLPEWTGYRSEADVGRVLLELFAHMGDIIGYYTDAVANESFLGTAQTRRGVLQHLRLIGYQLSTAVPATASLTIRMTKQPDASVAVRRGDAFVTASSPDAPSVRFEYAGVDDFVLDRGDWLPDAEGFVAKRRLPVTEGRLVREVIGQSDGTGHQRFPLLHPRLILRPAGVDPDVTIKDGSPTEWSRQETLAFSGADQPHFTVEIDDQDRAVVVFGELAPPVQAIVRAEYRVGGGDQGNVAAHTITTVADASGIPAAQVDNAERAVGGAERESIEHAVRQAPSAFRSLGRAVTVADYETLALAFGGVGKVRARARPGGEVLLTVAPSGGGQVNDVLRPGLAAYFEDKRAIGTRITVGNADYVPIFVTAVVDVEHYFSNRRIERQVRAAIRAVLSFERSDFGQTIYLSKFFEAIEAVDGVAGVNIAEFATHGQAPPVEPHGKIQLTETQVATVPGPDLPTRAGWTPDDIANGVKVTATGGFP